MKHKIWEVGEKMVELKQAQISSSGELEEMVCSNFPILNEGWLLMGQDVSSVYGRTVDLLAVDVYGSLIIIEFKRDETPCNVVMDSIDNAMWANDICLLQLMSIYEEFSKNYNLDTSDLGEAFHAKFDVDISECKINNSHEIVVVSTGLDQRTIRLISYLNQAGVSIGFVEFNIFEHDGKKFISRDWSED